MITKSNLLYQINAIKKFEEIAVEKYGISVDALMQRAGQAAFSTLQQKWPKAKNIVVLCGKGNNAGDGYVIATSAHKAKLNVKVLNLTPLNALKGAAYNAAKLCQKEEVNIKSLPLLNEKAYEQSSRELQEALYKELQGADVIVDALLGTGLKGALQPIYREVIAALNDAHLPVLAIDIPSGLSADTGAVEENSAAVQAQVTVTFIGLKCGLFTAKAFEFCGEIICDDLDLPEEIFRSTAAMPQAKVLDLATLRGKAFPEPRKRYAHKGNFGHVLVIGGDYGMGGAVRMAAEAAARVGAGLVSVATHKEHISAINAARPEIMCHGVEKGKDLLLLLKRATCVVIGPGLGKSKWSRKLFDEVLFGDWRLKKSQQNKNQNFSLVVDADALNLLAKMWHECNAAGRHCHCGCGAAQFAKIFEKWRNNWILTPHPSEAARLLGKESSASLVERDRYQAIIDLQNQYGGTVILKGAGTLIKGKVKSVSETKSDQEDNDKNKYDENNLVGVCPYGNPGMASGGMGDILSGIIGGLLAQGLNLSAAAKLGVCLHAKAGDMAAGDSGERGLLALDLLPHVRVLLNEA